MRKILIGCGIAAAMCLALVVVVGIVIGSYVKKRIPDLKRVEQQAADMKSRFGAVDSFVPPLDGSLPADRLALFVTLRDSMALYRAAAAPTLEFIADAKQPRAPQRPLAERVGDKLGMMQGGLSMAAGLIDYFTHLQELLLKKEMGQGEYEYLRALTSFAWLQWDPLAVPQDVEDLRRLSLLSEVEAGPAEIRRTFRAQLGNARRALEALPQRDAAQEAFLVQLRSELDQPGSTAGFPFAGRLPATWTQALEPYRARLQAALPHGAPEIAVELMRPSDEEGGFQFGIGERHGRRHHRGASPSDSTARRAPAR